MITILYVTYIIGIICCLTLLFRLFLSHKSFKQKIKWYLIYAFIFTIFIIGEELIYTEIRDNIFYESDNLHVRTLSKILYEYVQLKKEVKELYQDVSLLARSDEEKEIFQTMVDQRISPSMFSSNQKPEKDVRLGIATLKDVAGVLKAMKVPEVIHPVIFAFPNPDSYFMVAYNENTKTAYPVYVGYKGWEEIGIPGKGKFLGQGDIKTLRNKIIFNYRNDTKQLQYRVLLASDLQRKMNKLKKSAYDDKRFAYMYEKLLNRLSHFFEKQK